MLRHVVLVGQEWIYALGDLYIHLDCIGMLFVAYKLLYGVCDSIQTWTGSVIAYSMLSLSFLVFLLYFKWFNKYNDTCVCPVTEEH